MFPVTFYKLKCIILHVLHVKCDIVRSVISNRMLNGKMPKVVGEKDSTPEILLALLWDLSCSQKLGVYMEHEPKSMEPCLAQLFV